MQNDSDAKISTYWIRENDGVITAALVETAFTDDELDVELAEMKKYGPVRRVFSSKIVIGERALA